MPDEIIIRHATTSDLDLFRELRLEALKNHPTAFGADYEESAARPNEYWQERLKIDKDHEALFFAEHEESIRQAWQAYSEVRQRRAATNPPSGEYT